MGRVQDKVVIITGGSQEIGEAIVHRLADEGAKVIITDISVDQGENLAKELGENITFIKHDVSNVDDWKNVLHKVDEKYGKVDVLVNNAGISILGSVDDMSEKDYMKNINVNQHSVFYGMKLVKPLMDKAGVGSIINLSFIAGIIGSQGGTGDNGSKFAIPGMTKTAVLDYAKVNIRVNSIHPGLIETPILSVLSDEYREILTNSISGKPKEIANLTLFLASDKSTYCTGAEFVANGGFSVQ